MVFSGGEGSANMRQGTDSFTLEKQDYANTMSSQASGARTTERVGAPSLHGCLTRVLLEQGRSFFSRCMI